MTDKIQVYPDVALELQGLFWRAGVHPLRLVEQLASIEKALDEDEAGLKMGGRPKDHFLSDFFCELEHIYIRAGGTRTGVTKSTTTLDHTRSSPFADFVNAILLFAPGYGPSSSQAVAAAWERQRRLAMKK